MELIVDALAVRRGGRTLIDGIDARFPAGQITAILGPNGAGKSTLLKAMAGLLPTASGTVRIDGEPVATMDPRRRARHIGYLPQDATVHWNLAVRDVVALGRMPHRPPYAAPGAADAAAVARAMRATETLALADRLVLTLSGGERARVLLARVLAGEPDWLLADEPLASLDPAFQLDMLGQLRAVANGGAGVVLVMHDLAMALRVTDRALLLKDGRVAAAGITGDVLSPAHIARTYGVAVEIGRTGSGMTCLVPTHRL